MACVHSRGKLGAQELSCGRIVLLQLAAVNMRDVIDSAGKGKRLAAAVYSGGMLRAFAIVGVLLAASGVVEAQGTADTPVDFVNVAVNCQSIQIPAELAQPIWISDNPGAGIRVKNECADTLYAINDEAPNDRIRVPAGTPITLDGELLALRDVDRDGRVALVLAIQRDGDDTSRGVGVIRIALRRGAPGQERALMSAAAVSAATVSTLAAPADAASACAALIAKQEAVDVFLDRTGVASIQFLNPRYPPYLGPPPCASEETQKEEVLSQSHADLS